MSDLSEDVEQLLGLCDDVFAAFQTDRIPPELPDWQRAVHHQSYLLTRIGNIRLIIERLGQANAELVAMSYEADERWPDRYQKTDSPELSEHNRKEYRLTEEMQLDMESLFIYGNLVLDQLALFFKLRHQVPGSMSNWKFPFDQLCQQIRNAHNQDPALVALRAASERETWWLELNVRIY